MSNQTKRSQVKPSRTKPLKPPLASKVVSSGNAPFWYWHSLLKNQTFQWSNYALTFFESWAISKNIAIYSTSLYNSMGRILSKCWKFAPYGELFSSAAFFVKIFLNHLSFIEFQSLLKYFKINCWFGCKNVSWLVKEKSPLGHSLLSPSTQLTALRIEVVHV